MFLGIQGGHNISWDGSEGTLSIKGAIDVTSFEDVIEGGVSIDSGGMYMAGANAKITAHATDDSVSYEQNSSIFLGLVSNTPHLSLMDIDGSEYLKWTGSALEISGTINITGWQDDDDLAGILGVQAQTVTAQNTANTANGLANTANNAANDAQDAIDTMETRVVIDNTGMALKAKDDVGDPDLGGQDIAHFGTTTYFYDGSTSENVKLQINASGLALYGSTIYEGLTINSGGITLYEDVSSTASQVAHFGETVTIGNPESAHTLIDSSSVTVQPYGDTPAPRDFKMTLENGLNIYSHDAESLETNLFNVHETLYFKPATNGVGSDANDLAFMRIRGQMSTGVYSEAYIGLYDHNADIGGTGDVGLIRWGGLLEASQTVEPYSAIDGIYVAMSAVDQAAKGIPSSSGFFAEATKSLGTDPPNWENITGNPADGYVWLPGGVLMQWGTLGDGTANDLATTEDLTFPIAFPNNVFNVQATYGVETNTNGLDWGAGVRLEDLDTSGCKFTTYTSYELVFWFAIGN